MIPNTTWTETLFFMLQLKLNSPFANLFPCRCVCHLLQRHSKSRLTCQNVEKEDDAQERSGREAGGQFNR